MKSTDSDLHALIHSLSPHEKGYFVKQKQHYPAKKELKHMAMFNALAAMTPFDAVLFRAQCKANMFGNHPHRVRYYLYHSLLQMISNYRFVNEKNQNALLQLHEADLLIQRHMPQQAAHALDKAEKQTQQGTTNGLRIETLHRQITQVAINGTSHQEATMKQLCASMKATIKAEKYHVRLLHRYYKLKTEYINHGTAHSTKQRDHVECLYAPLASSTPTEHTPVADVYLWHRATYWYAMLLGNDALAIATLEQARHALLPYRHLPGHLADDVQCVIDLVPLWLCAKRYTTAAQHLKAVQLALEDNRALFDPTLWHVLHLHWQLCRLDLALHSPTALRHLPTAAQMLHTLSQQHLPAHESTRLRYCTALHYMYAGQWAEALPVLSALHALKPSDQSTQWKQCQAIELALMRIVVHAQLQHFDAVDDHCAALQRQLSHASPAHRHLANIILKAYRHYPYTTPSKQPQWRTQLAATLHALHRNPSRIAVDFERLICPA